MSDSSGPYDPNAVEGDRSGGAQYVTRKDFKTVAIVLVVLCVLFYPIYRELQGNSERTRCKANIRAISNAVSQYAEQHDNRYPPVFRPAEDGERPALTENDLPYTWVSDVAPYMNARQSFLCPTATDKESVANESIVAGLKSSPSTYGMYLPYGGLLTSLVESPEQTIIIAETSDRGAEKSFDPVPYADRPDGFAIAWSNTNTLPDKKTTAVSRLAFPDETDSRHGKSIYALSASGELVQLHPDDAAYRLEGIGGTNPRWKLPPGYPSSNR